MPKRSTRKHPTLKSVETLMHDEASRKNIPTAEYQSVLQKEETLPVRVSVDRRVSGLEDEKAARNRDLDPQLLWRGKDEQDWSDLVVQAPPIYIQEKVHPKVLIDDLLRRTKAKQKESEHASEPQFDLFADFNGLPTDDAKTEFYQHDANWTNRMILGDSLQVMASLAEREGLRGKVQCIYIDPPYGIKFNSNFQWSTSSRDVKDGKAEHITREPEQVKAFRDTWRDGIHSYLTYLRDRITIARDLLAESGSIFVQIGDENVHRVRALMEELFGEENFCGAIVAKKTGGQSSTLVPRVYDTVLWFAKNIEHVKYRALFVEKVAGEGGAGSYTRVLNEQGQWRQATQDEISVGASVDGNSLFAPTPLTSDSHGATGIAPYAFRGKSYSPAARSMWKTTVEGLHRLSHSTRIVSTENSLRFVRYISDFPATPLTTIWEDLGAGSFTEQRIYVVQTRTKLVQRCLLMTTDAGDLVVDPTCGSGTTAYVAEQWGRRWITIDTSRVALALARARIVGARYPFYLLTDSRQGQLKEREVTGTVPSEQSVHGDIRHGFVCERVPHITLKSIANNAEIDVIWDKWQEKLEPLREKLNAALQKQWQEWEIPREAETKWSDKVKKIHGEWWQARTIRQKEIDASIAAKAEFEYLYDKPYSDNKRVRVAGPFTVESLSPHRVLPVDENDNVMHGNGDSQEGDERDFVRRILENLKTSGVQQAHKEDKIAFASLVPWPGNFICAEGRYHESDKNSGPEKRAAIFIGPEFGTVSRPDLVLAAREAGDADFDVLITCAFNYDAHSSEFKKLGRIPVLKARMNADLHMSDELKNTGKGNLFVIFGEPEIDILDPNNISLKKKVDGAERYEVPDGIQIKVKVIGVDVFHPNTGEVRSDGPEGIACWFIDTDYNGESFFVRHAYFLGQNDPYKALKTTLKAEINEEAWATLHSDTSRPFDKPDSGRIAVKVINHLGDEVMKVFKV